MRWAHRTAHAGRSALCAFAHTTGARARFLLRTRLHNPSEPDKKSPRRAPEHFILWNYQLAPRITSNMPVYGLFAQSRAPVF